MSQEPDWRDAGLDDDQIYSMEALERFWLKYDDPLEFLKSISHELREQIHPIQAVSRLLRDEKQRHTVLDNLDLWTNILDKTSETQLQITRVINAYFEHKLTDLNSQNENS